MDEAGQISVANLVGMTPSARKIVLPGDQVQLGQPIQGRHPGESGTSILEYSIPGHDTISRDRGLFLKPSGRMHPGICSFISDAVYEGRLAPEPHTVNRRAKLPAGGETLVRQEAGELSVPVEHEGNVQASGEEVAVIRRIVNELVGRDLTGNRGEVAGRVAAHRNILFVAPYNIQVRRLKKAPPVNPAPLPTGFEP